MRGVHDTLKRISDDKVFRQYASHSSVFHGKKPKLTKMSSKWTPTSEGVARGS